MDEHSLRAFVDADYARVVAAVALITGDRSSAEDAVQDALLKAWRRSERIRSLAGWVTVVAANGARSARRRRGSEQRANARYRQAPVAPTTTPQDLDLMRAVAGLPTRQREAVVLHYYLDLSVQDIASTLRCSEGTIKTSLHRARRALAKALDGERYGEDDRARR